MLLYGVHPVAELLRRLATERRAAQPGLTLLLARDNAALRRLRGQAQGLGIPVRSVSVAELSARCGSHAHRGVALITAPAGKPPATDRPAPRNRRLAAPLSAQPPLPYGAVSELPLTRQSDRLLAAGGARPGPGDGPSRGDGPGRGGGRRGVASARPGAAGGGAGRGGLREHLAALAQWPAVLAVVADGVTDPANLGSIVRSADQFAADLVLIPRRRTARVSDTVMRLSAGAAAHVATVTVANVAAALAQLKASGCWIYGADLKGEPLDQVRFPGRVALVMGAEGGGLHALVRSRCDHLVRIPTAGQVGSLNVGVAAGILMYEVRRQQRAAAAPTRG